MHAAHLTREIHHLTRPEKNWKHHKAWLALKDAAIQRFDGEVGMYMQAGDVIVVEFGWDRDVVITQNPINTNMVSGYLLSGRWPGMIGLFMPLFDKITIMKCIELRATENVRDSMSMAEKESLDWQWY